MNVTFLTASLSRRGGGLFTSVRRLAQSLQASGPGVRVNVLGLHDEDTVQDLHEWEGIDVAAERRLGPRQFGYCPTWSRRLDEWSPEVLFIHGLWIYSSVVGPRWSRASQRPYIVSPHGMLNDQAIRHKAWKKRVAARLYENASLRHAACLRALNEAEAAELRAYGLSNPICILPNGIDLPEVSPSKDGETLTCLYIGRIHPLKGLAALLRGWAVHQLEARRTGWRLTIAGWDQEGHEQELRRLSQELSITDLVEFAGPKFGDSKAALFRTASAFVLPSLSEGMPVTVLEAWSYGLPAILTPECNLRTGIQAGAAIEIQHRDGGIDGLQRMFALSPSELRDMGLRGRELVSESTGWDEIGTEALRLCEWVLGRGPKPNCVV